jgi:hypothetical protein
MVSHGVALLDKVLMVAVNARDSSLVELICLDDGYIRNEGHNTERILGRWESSHTTR